MSIDLEFSRFASSYATYNIVQEKVVKELLGLLKYQPKKILDLGCGRGAIAEKISWEVEFFLGVDFAKAMLELHPKTENINCIYGNFDNKALFEELMVYDFDYILSASALQWSCDIDKLFSNIKQLYFKDFVFAIFTSNTFKTLHNIAKISSPLRSTQVLQESIQKNFTHYNSHVQTYKLEFENNLEMFRYIKKSGVSGNRGVLSYKQMKDLIKNYPLSYLEFEVLFVYS